MVTWSDTEGILIKFVDLETAAKAGKLGDAVEVSHQQLFVVHTGSFTKRCRLMKGLAVYTIPNPGHIPRAWHGE